MQLSRSETNVLHLLSSSESPRKTLLKSVDQSNLDKLEKYRLIQRQGNNYSLTQLGLRQLSLAGI